MPRISIPNALNPFDSRLVWGFSRLCAERCGLGGAFYPQIVAGQTGENCGTPPVRMDRLVCGNARSSANPHTPRWIIGPAQRQISAEFAVIGAAGDEFAGRARSLL